jgi:hypothetical protein
MAYNFLVGELVVYDPISANGTRRAGTAGVRFNNASATLHSSISIPEISERGVGCGRLSVRRDAAVLLRPINIPVRMDAPPNGWFPIASEWNCGGTDPRLVEGMLRVMTGVSKIGSLMSGCPQLVVKLKRGGAMASVAVAPRRDSQQLVVERNNGGMGKILIIELEDVLRSIEVKGHVLFETLRAAKRMSRPLLLTGTPRGV